MSGPMTSAIALALIGYGEVGQIFAQEFRAQGVNDIAVYDIVFDLAPTGRERAKRAREAQVRPASSAADAAPRPDNVSSAGGRDSWPRYPDIGCDRRRARCSGDAGGQIPAARTDLLRHQFGVPGDQTRVGAIRRGSVGAFPGR